MFHRERQALIMLDGGKWCFARLVGPGWRKSGVRVQPTQASGEGDQTFTVVSATSGIGFAL